MSFLSKVKDFFASFSPTEADKQNTSSNQATTEEEPFLIFDDEVSIIRDEPVSEREEQSENESTEPNEVSFATVKEADSEQENDPEEGYAEEEGGNKIQESETEQDIIDSAEVSEPDAVTEPEPEPKIEIEIEAKAEPESKPEPEISANNEPIQDENSIEPVHDTPAPPEPAEVKAEMPAADTLTEAEEKPKAERVLTEKECKILTRRANKIVSKLEIALLDYQRKNDIYWPSEQLVAVTQIMESVVLRVQLGRDYPKAEKTLRAVVELTMDAEHLDERMADKSVAVAVNAPKLWRYLWDLIQSQPAGKDWDIYLEMLREFVSLFDDKTLDHRLIEFIADPPVIPTMKPFQPNPNQDIDAIAENNDLQENEESAQAPGSSVFDLTEPKSEPAAEVESEFKPAPEDTLTAETELDIVAENEPEGVSENIPAQKSVPGEDGTQSTSDSADDEGREKGAGEELTEDGTENANASTANMSDEAENAAKPSVVITDLKGEIYEKLSETLTAQGYEIRTLSLKNMGEMGFWNVFSAISDDKVDQCVDIIVDTLMANFQDGGKTVEDNIYINGEKLLLKALILRVYLGMDYPAEKKNLHSVYELAIRNDVDAVMSDETCAVSKSVFDAWFTPWEKSYCSFTGNLKGNIYTNLLADIASFAPVCEKADKKGETDKEDASTTVATGAEAETVVEPEDAVTPQEDVVASDKTEEVEEAEDESTSDIPPKPVISAPESSPEPVNPATELAEPMPAEPVSIEQEQGEEGGSNEPIPDDTPASEIVQESKENGQGKEDPSEPETGDAAFIESEPVPGGDDSECDREGKGKQTESTENESVAVLDVSTKVEVSGEGESENTPAEEAPIPEMDTPAPADVTRADEGKQENLIEEN